MALLSFSFFLPFFPSFYLNPTWLTHGVIPVSGVEFSDSPLSFDAQCSSQQRARVSESAPEGQGSRFTLLLAQQRHGPPPIASPVPGLGICARRGQSDTKAVLRRGLNLH